METIRSVPEIEQADRKALEHVLGQPLRDDQQVIIRVIGPHESNLQQANGGASEDDAALPEWCKVYEGLSDEQIVSIEEVMLTRADLTRPS